MKLIEPIIRRDYGDPSKRTMPYKAWLKLWEDYGKFDEQSLDEIEQIREFGVTEDKW